MTKQAIQKEVLSYILENFFQGKKEALNSKTELLTTGILDSISALTMVDFIEGKFGIEFEAHEVDQDNLNSIESITQFILAKRNA